MTCRKVKKWYLKIYLCDKDPDTNMKNIFKNIGLLFEMIEHDDFL